jgi:hypothetical protein
VARLEMMLSVVMIVGLNELREMYVVFSESSQLLIHSLPGMIRFINASNIGTVNAVSPWLGIQIIPLEMS